MAASPDRFNQSVKNAWNHRIHRFWTFLIPVELGGGFN